LIENNQLNRETTGRQRACTTRLPNQRSQETRLGIITRAEALPTNGGTAYFGLTFEPPLALLHSRRTSRVFQDKTVPVIVQTFLDEHLAANQHHRLQLRLPLRSHQ
jgi:uncharacterized protein involved in type VI secretion and phage assembly